jgi:Rrf2 family protein
MLRLSRKALLTIEVVLDIALNSTSRPMPAAEVCRRNGIPPRYLEQVMQELVRRGILTAQRGPRGGYRLGRERRRITLAEIVEIVQDIEGGEDPLEQSGGSEIARRIVRPYCHELRDRLVERLAETTIGDLCIRAQAQRIVAKQDITPDFVI